MSVRMRAYAGENDLRRLCDFLLALDRPCLHAGDLQWMLSNPLVNPEADVRVWEDAGGRIIAFAFLYLPSRALEIELDPLAWGTGIETQAMIWVMLRMQQVALASGSRVVLHAGAREGDHERIALFDRYGFMPHDWSMVHVERRLDSPILAARVPEGFTLRHLDAVGEVPAYVALHREVFPKDGMTFEWRQRTRSMPHYIPELDLVVVAPDGTIAAFALAWLNQSDDASDGRRKVGQVEPIGKRPEPRGMDVPRAVLFEAFRRLQAFGAEAAVGHVLSFNRPALRLITSVGARPIHHVRYYFKEFQPG